MLQLIAWLSIRPFHTKHLGESSFSFSFFLNLIPSAVDSDQHTVGIVVSSEIKL